VIIAQVVLPGASEYERKSQKIDFDALSVDHDVRIGGMENADVVHVYAPRALDPLELHIPYVSNARPKRRRFRKTIEPHSVVTPLKDTADVYIPEAVQEIYFRQGEGRSGTTIGTYARKDLGNIIEQTAARIQRFRDDVEWLLFDAPPTPEDLRSVDLWVDPAASEEDFDGFVAEAIAAGTAVVASRTAINVQRLEKGRTGVLVPPRDPNEWTHAILTALFKPESRHSKTVAAQQTVSKFRARHRAAALLQLYKSILG
jgi:hypothetical protein